MVDKDMAKRQSLINFVEEDHMNRLQQVAERWNGQIFGELALISHKPRAATVTTLTDCHFATLDRRTFQIIKTNHEKQINKKVDFIKNVPFFNKMTHVAL